MLFVLSPILFLSLLEAGLRLGGYGYPTQFFLGPDTGGTYTTNDRFGWRFFPRALARDPHPCILSAKPAGAVRIFVLGSSAAMGTPDPAFSFGRILEVMLREQYPGTPFEVVNAAMTAINSHVALEIARDCAARAPDLFVVYMGNNEVTGPYGPGTVFQQWTPSLKFVRTSLRVKVTRVGQLLSDIGGYFRRNEGTPDRWRGMEMFQNNPVAADDARLTVVYDNYRRNLTDICRIARRARAAVVLSTVAVNLRDCPPFGSRHRYGLSPGDLAKWELLYQASAAFEASNRWPEALEQYEGAAKIDDRFAELQFRIGQCLLKAGRLAEARARCELARDLDVLRFRADSRINAIIREVAEEQEAAGVRLADAVLALAESDPASKGIPRGDLFYEHVHLTFDGNYLLARAVLNQVCAALPQLAALRKPDAIPSRQRCAELLALTPWDEYEASANMVNMTSKAPFTNQFNHSLRQTAARQRRDAVRTLALTPEAMQTAWKTYAAALANAPDDWSLHHHFGRLAMECGRLDVAIEQLRIAVERLPWAAPLRNELGSALAAQGQVDEAIAQHQRALEIKPDLAEAHYNLGIALASRGQVDEAIAHYQKALEIKPDFAEPHNNLGIVFFQMGRVGEAVAHFRKALDIQSDDAEAHNNLGVVLAGCGQVEEAIAHYQKALESTPDYAQAHVNLGCALKRAGKEEEAILHFRRALELQPGNVAAEKNLNAILRPAVPR